MKRTGLVTSGIIIPALLLALLVTAHPAAARSISADIKPKTVTVGEPVTCTITLENFEKDEITVSLPEKGNYWLEKDDRPRPVPHYAVKDAKEEPAPGDAPRTRRYTVTMVFYHPGTHSMPLINIKDNEGNAVAYRQPELTVKPVNRDGKLADIEPPVMIGTGTKYWIFFLMGGVLLALAGFGIYRYMEHRRAAAYSAREPVMQPFDVFDEKLGDLLMEYEKDTSRHEWFITSLDLAFREFLGRQLGIDAMEMTAGEIRQSVRQQVTRLQWDYYSVSLKRLYELWNAVKFAELVPPEAECRHSATLAREVASRMTREVRPRVP